MSGPRVLTRAYVALGSNLGVPSERLDAACAALRATPGIERVRVSSYHATAAVGGPAAQPDYLNAVAELDTTLGPEELLARLQAIEAAEGRERATEVRWGPRRLDLDLLLHGDARRDADALALPHPRLEERRFVLAPLAELAPELVLARSGRTVAARARRAAARGAPPLARLRRGRARARLVPRAPRRRARRWASCRPWARCTRATSSSCAARSPRTTSPA
ncbi:MAG: 2-amino-4-hydroxy-6-hydroxymethyldihydropteridine diphosphokinase [Planctomycetes bacterium]|nr:2-amino-4-hydroxy-6-hydroxymethyldihydropteridine diphosphokinase [Planctomycetota bacterium]